MSKIIKSHNNSGVLVESTAGLIRPRRRIKIMEKVVVVNIVVVVVVVVIIDVTVIGSLKT